MRAPAAACMLFLLSACAARPTTPPEHDWPQPCDDCIAGVRNFAKVTEKLWRGGQPAQGDPEVFRRLAAAGVKTVINLRHDHDDYAALAGAGLRYVHIPMRAWHPESDDVVLFLAELERAMADPGAWPVYVHCAEGKDRTGYMIASYRIVEQGWDADTAIEEMFDFHFNRIYVRNPPFLRRLAEHRAEIRAKLDRSP